VGDRLRAVTVRVPGQTPRAPRRLGILLPYLNPTRDHMLAMNIKKNARIMMPITQPTIFQVMADL
jgi:hypothetical protein